MCPIPGKVAGTSCAYEVKKRAMFDAHPAFRVGGC